MKKQNAKQDTDAAVVAELQSHDWNDTPRAYSKRLQQLARDEGKRLWEERETWGAGCKGFLDFMHAGEKLFLDGPYNTHDINAASGLARSLASRLANVPPELADEVRKAARRLDALANLCTLYVFGVRESLGKQQDKALDAGKIPV